MLFADRRSSNTNFIVFGLTQPRREPTTLHTWGEHPNHYNTDAIIINENFPIMNFHLCSNIPSYGRGCRVRDRMVVGFTTYYAINAYHH